MKRITFFSDCQSQTGNVTSENQGCVQQYDLISNSWLQMKRIPVCKPSNFSICQEGDHIRMVGGVLGARAVSLKYDVNRNVIKFDGFTNFNAKRKANLVSFKNNLYFIGGKIKKYKSHTVYYANSTNEWRSANGLKIPRSSAVALTTLQYMYVIGGASDQKLHIECNSFGDGETTAWKQIENPKASKELKPRNFFASQDKLCCLYTLENYIVYATYGHRKKCWRYVKVRYNGLIIDYVCQFSQANSTYQGIHLYVKRRHSMVASSNWVPNYVFNYHGLHESAASRGNREIELSDSLQIVYTDK